MAKILETLQSKKFQALVVGIATALSADTVPGLFQLSPDTMKFIIALIMTYMGVVGLTDHGKEKAKIAKP